MKARSIIGLLLISIIFISGCASSNNQIVCNKPYIQVGTECCLDENSNNICDKDEAQKPTYGQEFVVTNCYLPGNSVGSTEFGCSNFKIYKNIIKLIITSNTEEIRSIKSIELPNIGSSGCSKTFNSSFGEAIKYKGTKQIEINCDFLGEESIYSKMKITYVLYNKDGTFIDKKEQFYTGVIEGYVEGMVK